MTTICMFAQTCLHTFFAAYVKPLSNTWNNSLITYNVSQKTSNIPVSYNDHLNATDSH